MWSKGYQIPAAVQAAMAPGTAAAAGEPERVIWWWDIVQHWDLVLADMASLFGVDLYDPAVLARPSPGIRTLILTLPGNPRSLLHHALGGDS